MKASDALLFIAQGVLKSLHKELDKRNAAYEQQKRSENLRKGSIDAEFKVIKE